MLKRDLILYFYSGNGKRLSFTANVILNGCRNPAKKLRGLYMLAQGDRVSQTPFSTMQVRIDGVDRDLSDLETFA